MAINAQSKFNFGQHVQYLEARTSNPRDFNESRPFFDWDHDSSALVRAEKLRSPLQNVVLNAPASRARKGRTITSTRSSAA